ncbi:MAG: hypothetical protein ACXW1T_06155 [Methylophilus sp.]
MIFAVSPGSQGSGKVRFVASIPFILSPGRQLQFAENAVHTLDTDTEVKLEKLQLRYLVSIGPFLTEPEAKNGLERLNAALLWSALELDFGLKYPSELGLIHFYEQPIPIANIEPMSHIGRITGWEETDGYYDADSTVIRPDHKKLVRFEPGQATLTLGIPSGNFLTKLAEALNFRDSANMINDAKLRLAIEIYMGHRFEVSDNAKFIGLVTALEALLPNLEIHPAASEVLSTARSTLLEKRNCHPKASLEWEQINNLLSRMNFLSHESIGVTMRQFALATIERHPDIGESNETSKALKDAYDVRSRLLHDGHTDSALLNEKLSFLQKFVPKLLRALFLDAVS